MKDIIQKIKKSLDEHEVKYISINGKNVSVGFGYTMVYTVYLYLDINQSEPRYITISDYNKKSFNENIKFNAYDTIIEKQVEEIAKDYHKLVEYLKSNEEE